jgi:hypothetical protein
MAATLLPDAWQRLARRRAAWAERRHWDERIANVLACPDSSRLERVRDAGRIVGDYQVMHNGVKVAVNGYYGDGITRMLTANRGCHEPQEEVVFDAVVKSLEPGATMLELGAYWGFYSLWFCQVVKDPKVYLVEPSSENLAIGRRNFELNGQRGVFMNAYVGSEEGVAQDGTRVLSVAAFFREAGLETLQLLHADVQGHELDMLRGTGTLLDEQRIDYLFVSTHRADLHAGCEEFLRVRGYRVLASVDLDQTYSYDGVLVACSPRVRPPRFAPPATRDRPGASLPS